MSHHDSKMSPHTLPTPAPSTEILPGKRGSLSEHTFALPPAAIAGQASDSPASMTTPSPVNSDSSYRPLSPPSNSSQKAAAARRKSSTTNSQSNGSGANQGSYTLPPPPTRNRKIIQMKPGQVGQEQPIAPAKAIAPGVPAANMGATNPSAPKSSPAQAGSKRKQSGAGNTAASRKIARKTAHSLIERRRRSKMNEEFGVLKDMIPACHEQEMHKLASKYHLLVLNVRAETNIRTVLQASIEYMRYLEQCLADLKTAHANCGASATQPQLPSFSQIDRHGDSTPTAATFRGDADEESDEEMSDAPSPRSVRPRSGSSIQSHQLSVSPAILPSAQTSPEILAKPSKFGSYGSVYQSHPHSARSSALPSPAFEPQTQASGPGGYSTNFAPLTNPALRPQAEVMEKDDHEATAALLMLNTDRRSWSSSGGNANGRSMSVRDLLSG